MRCTTARKVMVASLDGAATDAERHRLAAHLGDCSACSRDYEQTRRLSRALEDLGPEIGVPGALEDAVMRRIRTLEEERLTVLERLRAWLPTPVLLAGAAVAMAVLVVDVSDRGSGTDDPGRSALPQPAARVATAPPPPDEPRDEGTAVRVASGAGLAPPSEPPADLTASLPLLLDMPILRNMEKLENFDRIEALTLAEDEGSNG